MRDQHHESLSRLEFIALMAAMISLDAFSIDAMIPALHHISMDLNIATDNHRQYIVTSIFLGFSIGVLFYGFLSDAFGRKIPVIAGFMIYVVGVVVCLTADKFSVLLLGRIIQGIGVAGPYVLSLAIIRDRYSGLKMAQVMSFIMMVFITVPIIAPLAGQGILMLSDWRGIFSTMGLFAVLVLAWFWLRQKETLDLENRTQFHLNEIVRQTKQIVSNTQSLRYMLALGMVSGAFFTYLSTSQQVFQEIYQLGDLFPIVFASISASFGLSSYFNSRWSESIELTALINSSLMIIVSASLVMTCIRLFSPANPSLAVFILYMLCVFFCYGLLFGNITTLALEPMGHIAGSASSIVTSISTLLSIILATLVGSQLENTIYPVVTGFGALCFFALLLNRLSTLKIKK
jgi:DHA1 family bicyclomycin/chloramphenicol resistance-like MFS transporter